MEGADQNSFESSGGDYARDNKNVYWEAGIIPGAEPNSFVCLGKNYGKDKANVFWERSVIKGADPKSFQLIDTAWSRDQKDFYFKDRPMGVTDLPPFKILKQGWARDKVAHDSVHQSGRVDCDYPTLGILNDGYAIDEHGADYKGGPIAGVAVKTFPATSNFTAEDQYRKY